MIVSETVTDALASFRLARLVMADTFPPARRARTLIRQKGPEWAAELIECPWCVGMYTSLGVVAARAVAPRAWDPLARALAISAAVGVFAVKTELLKEED